MHLFVTFCRDLCSPMSLSQHLTTLLLDRATVCSWGEWVLVCWCNLLKGRKTLYSCCWMNLVRPQPQRNLGRGARGLMLSLSVALSLSNIHTLGSPFPTSASQFSPDSFLCEVKGSQCERVHTETCTDCRYSCVFILNYMWLLKCQYNRTQKQIHFWKKGSQTESFPT